MDEKTVGLAEAIEQVRAELEQAREAGADKDLRFQLGEVLLEFAVELSKERGGDAGVRLWVVSVGTSGSMSSTRTHTVSVHLTPQIKKPDGVYEDAYVDDHVSAHPPAPDPVD